MNNHYQLLLIRAILAVYVPTLNVALMFLPRKCP